MCSLYIYTAMVKKSEITILEKIGPRIEHWPEVRLEAYDRVENSEGAVCGPVA